MTELVPMYAQMLVGMVAQWWLDARKPKMEVAVHPINLAWNGMSQLETKLGSPAK